MGQLKFRGYMLLFIICTVFSYSYAAVEKLDYEQTCITTRLTYDTSVISREEIKEYLELNPESDAISISNSLSPYLERCIAGNKKYKKCYSRDINDPNFLYNAEINLNFSEKAIAKWENNSKKSPKIFQELIRKYIAYMKNQQRLGYTKLKFYKMWDLNVLKQFRVGKFISKDVCNKEIDEISKNHDQRYKLTKIEWNNCINKIIHLDSPLPSHKEGREAWKKFLENYKINSKDLKNTYTCD